MVACAKIMILMTILGDMGKCMRNGENESINGGKWVIEFKVDLLYWIKWIEGSR